MVPRSLLPLHPSHLHAHPKPCLGNTAALKSNRSHRSHFTPTSTPLITLPGPGSGPSRVSLPWPWSPSFCSQHGSHSGLLQPHRSPPSPPHHPHRVPHPSESLNGPTWAHPPFSSPYLPVFTSTSSPFTHFAPPPPASCLAAPCLLPDARCPRAIAPAVSTSWHNLSQILHGWLPQPLMVLLIIQFKIASSPHTHPKYTPFARSLPYFSI